MEGARRQCWLPRVVDSTLHVCPIPSIGYSVTCKAAPSPLPSFALSLSLSLTHTHTHTLSHSLVCSSPLSHSLLVGEKHIRIDKNRQM